MRQGCSAERQHTVHIQQFFQRSMFGIGRIQSGGHVEQQWLGLRQEIHIHDFEQFLPLRKIEHGNRIEQIRFRLRQMQSLRSQSLLETLVTPP